MWQSSRPDALSKTRLMSDLPSLLESRISTRLPDSAQSSCFTLTFVPSGSFDSAMPDAFSSPEQPTTQERTTPTKSIGTDTTTHMGAASDFVRVMPLAGLRRYLGVCPLASHPKLRCKIRAKHMK